MAVSKRFRRKIVVRDKDYYWGIQGDYQRLVIVSDDKKFHFVRELSFFQHDYDYRWADEDICPPAPPESSGHDGYFQSHFKITPRYVRLVIEWCQDNGYEQGSPPT